MELRQARGSDKGLDGSVTFFGVDPCQCAKGRSSRSVHGQMALLYQKSNRVCVS